MYSNYVLYSNRGVGAIFAYTLIYGHGGHRGTNLKAAGQDFIADKR